MFAQSTAGIAGNRSHATSSSPAQKKGDMAHWVKKELPPVRFERTHLSIAQYCLQET